jgi:hypothetical protein
MPLTRAHTGGGALIVLTAAVWLFLAVPLSEDVVRVSSPDPVTAVPQAAAPPPRALSDAAIRELRLAAERAARETLLTATP